MNFVKIVPNECQTLTAEFHMGLDVPVAPNFEQLTLEEAISLAESENIGHCHDGFAIIKCDG